MKLSTLASVFRIKPREGLFPPPLWVWEDADFTLRIADDYRKIPHGRKVWHYTPSAQPWRVKVTLESM